MIVNRSTGPRALALAAACAFAAAASCATTLKQRIPDARRPAPATARVNFAMLVREGRRGVTRSPKLPATPLHKVVIAPPGGVVKAPHRDNILRSVRRALLTRQVDVVVGEVRAKAEAARGAPAPRGKLSEAEELILLGKDTGADAILVFDQLGTTGTLYDVAIAWNAPSGWFDTPPGPPGGALPTCPGGFRVKLPALVAAGRLVSATDATILAEIDVQQSLLANPERLAAPVEVIRYFPQEQRARDAYQSGEGCNPEYQEYEYIARWNAVDVLCAEIQKVLAPHIPPKNAGYAVFEQEADRAVDSMVAAMLGR